MSSILTNVGAMVALQSLKSINSDLGKVQSEISTGKSVANAKDNSALWAISKVMESDVEGFKAISSSLDLGESTVAVARSAAEATTDFLIEMKKEIISAQEEGFDGEKLQAKITELTDQIASTVGAAQFNGVNLVNGGGDISVLASLDRDAAGNVTSNSITVAAQDLSTSGYTAKDVFTGSDGVSGNGDMFGTSVDDGADGTIVFAEGGAFAAGDTFTVNVGDQSVSYTVSDADAAATTTADIVATGIRDKLNALYASTDDPATPVYDADFVVDYDAGTPGTLVISNNSGNDTALSGSYKNADAGGLGALDGLNVSTAGGATAALGVIEGLIDTSVNAAASFGASQSRIEIQADFVSKLTDSLKTGIGTLVDADMEEASARLQALQTQQQLGIQSLSIANQAPQSLLSLFR